MKMKKKHTHRLRNNPVAQIFIFLPASVISTILVIPLTILALPLIIFPEKIQTSVMRFLLRIQHTLSLSCFYFLSKYFLEGYDFYAIEEIFLLYYVYNGYNKEINEMVNETLEKIWA